MLDPAHLQRLAADSRRTVQVVGGRVEQSRQLVAASRHCCDRSRLAMTAARRLLLTGSTSQDSAVILLSPPAGNVAPDGPPALTNRGQDAL